MRDVFRLLSSTRELRPYYLGIVLASVLTAATALAIPFVVKEATDVIVASLGGAAPDAVRTVLLLAALLLAIDLANTVITNIGGYLGDVMAARLRRIMSQRYFSHLLTLPQSYYDEQLTGTIVNRLNRSITETTQFLQSFSNNFFPMLLTIVAVVGISGYYAWPLALLLLILFPTFMWLTTLTSTRWQQLEGEKNTHLDSAGGRFAEVIGQIRVVKSFVQERRELGVFTGHYDETVGLTRTQSRYWHSMDASRRGALNVIFFGIYAVIFTRTVQGAFSLGVMVLLIQLVNMARQPVTIMSYLVDTGQRAIAGTRSYFEVLDEEPEPQSPVLTGEPHARPVAREVAPGEPMVRFADVSFGYGEGEDVVSGISFGIRPGERVALVGESGGGKSTLVSLLLGLYRPRSGGIVVAGEDLTGLPVAEHRSRVGVVFQEPALFSGSVRENIAYARPGATDAEIEEAARRANAHQFIAKFPDGYDTLIGERGLKLSGGQKQRIAVARAILKDAPILVLDEATSALDTKSERLVQAGLDSLMEGRTTLIIAHRLSTISTVDRIVTLKDGRVDEIGSPDELAQTGGIYAELLALQQTGTKQTKKKLAQYDITA